MADSKESRHNNLGNNSKYTITFGYFEKEYGKTIKLPPENANAMTGVNYGDSVIVPVYDHTVEKNGVRINEDGKVLTGAKKEENIEK